MMYIFSSFKHVGTGCLGATVYLPDRVCILKGLLNKFRLISIVVTEEKRGIDKVYFRLCAFIGGKNCLEGIGIRG